MRLAITGKTRSGKSTAMHCLLSHALRHVWAGVLLLDGKGSELRHYASVEGVRYLGPGDMETWAAALTAHANAMAGRYIGLVDRGLREAEEDDLRYLIVIDEVQKATRDKECGKEIKEALTLITEQSAALGDIVVMSTQREVNAIPPSTRANINCWLTMLGFGYFYLKPDGQNRTSGRTTLITPEEALETIASDKQPASFTIENIPAILGTQPVVPGRAPVTLYLGESGSGKTWHLAHHPRKHVRTITVDLALSHKPALETLIEAAGAVVPPRCRIPDMVEIAALALQAESTLLLLDNMDQASAKMIPTVERLIQAAGEVAVSARTPRTDSDHRKINPIIPRAKVHEIKALDKDTATDLVREHLPETVAEPDATERRITQLGSGHPGTLVNLATQTKRGTLSEIREYRAPKTTEPTSLVWVLLIGAMFGLLLWRADGYTVTAILMLTLYIIRRFAMQGIGDAFKK